MSALEIMKVRGTSEEVARWRATADDHGDSFNGWAHDVLNAAAGADPVAVAFAAVGKLNAKQRRQLDDRLGQVGAPERPSADDTPFRTPGMQQVGKRTYEPDPKGGRKK